MTTITTWISPDVTRDYERIALEKAIAESFRQSYLCKRPYKQPQTRPKVDATGNDPFSLR